MTVKQREYWTMIITVLLLLICDYARSSVEHGVPAPIVTAASSQYFERTFNRLVALPPPLEPVIPVSPAPPIFVQSVNPAPPVIPQNQPVEPNVAIAIATAHAAAPVATILLPPYPFGLPPPGLIPSPPPFNTPDEKPRKESTTAPSTQIVVSTTLKEPEATTPVPSNTDNNFVQALPSNQNVNFKEYYAPPILQLPLEDTRPQKLKTSVEVVPVPLTYIAPPPLFKHTALKLKAVPHVHAFVPKKTKIIVRPVVAPIRLRARIPSRIVAIRRPLARNIDLRFPQNVNLRPRSRDVEPTTLRPFNRPITKPPRL